MGPYRRCALFTLGLIVAAAPAARAQTADARKWEIAFHGGGLWPANPSGGAVTLPGPGQVFTTAIGQVSPPPTSRRQSSWYFGDGPVLFDQAALALAAPLPERIPGRILTLDPVLGRSLGEQKSGGSVGVTLTRSLTPRLSVELRADYSLARLGITASNVEAIEATRASFIPAFTDLIRFNPARVLNGVTSTAALDEGDAHQVIASGAMTVDLWTRGRIIPYATVGAGVIALIGDRPAATLQGNYRFLLPTSAPIDETDNVTVRDARDDRTFAGILGGGMKYHVSARWGIRFDARVFLSTNSANTVVDATPQVRLGLLPSGRGVLSGEPSIQFSNNSSDPVTALGVTAVAASTLTGPALTGFRTFSGSGVASVTNFTAGVFWRF